MGKRRRPHNERPQDRRGKRGRLSQEPQGPPPSHAPQRGLPYQKSQWTRPDQSRPDQKPYPAWFYRVRAICIVEDRDSHGIDFDEDISDIESESEDSEEDDGGCTCVIESEEEACDWCKAQENSSREYKSSDEEDEDEKYEGEDACEYYQLKFLRDERKLERAEWRKEMRNFRQWEREKEEEVIAVQEALLQEEADDDAKSTPMESLRGKQFNLYCCEHVEHFYSDLYGTKRVDFHETDDQHKTPSDDTIPGGVIYLDGSGSCKIAPFQPPEYASSDVVVVKSENGKHDFLFKFLSNSHLMLRAHRDSLYGEYGNPPPTCPETFVFYGILRPPRQPREAVEEPPSPRCPWASQYYPDW